MPKRHQALSLLDFSNQSVRTTKFWTVLTETLITEQGWNVTTISSEDGGYQIVHRRAGVTRKVRPSLTAKIHLLPTEW